ncbi:alpha/beta fold hydrolase [Pyxidicoccus fallax]|uniref:Alpha/beta fold hydrolase n=1 Tax=Pyxidicoccus fallax TaxID=394095 RepID=A0A848LYM2_9BACT|nr:alpha/beta hydrolase [Pyxidicoccus fallax]NMO22729.1 alpha/beta fold hydrolase [Pyxidicoccus fallax]NPC84913.1 alpha/beta fold hydrolase [Pyxidicoccus fallax]
MDATPVTRTAAVEGMELHYAVRGEGAPLVLLHGFTGTGSDWTHVFDLEALARRYRLIIPDLRGHGRSNNPSGTFTMRQCAMDVLALMDTLGIERFRAIGMSLGGNTLLHIATRAPARVERMVLVSSPPYYPAQARRIMATFTEEGRTEAEWAEMRARHSLGDEQIRALWRHGRGFADSYDDMNFTPPLLSTISAPTLIVYGDGDPLYPVELGLELYRAIPQSRLWVVPGGGHGPIFLEHRDAFARTALAFLG